MNYQEFTFLPSRTVTISNVCIMQDLQEELQGRLTQQASLQALWSQLQPEEGAEESAEAQEKLHVTGSKLKLLLRQVDRDLTTLQQRLVRLQRPQ